MNVELVNTGSELMLGCVLNSHQQWLCRQLSDLGYCVHRQVAVPDAGPAIRDAVREALLRSDAVIVTGGLGPTSDDVTREQVAELLGRTLRPDPDVLGHIERFFARRGLETPPATRVQAMVPEGARVLPNANGTAPGLALELEASSGNAGFRARWLILLPGPPRELRPMFQEQVVPLLKGHCPPLAPAASRTLFTTGLGESLLEQRIAGPLASLCRQGLEIGYCARVGEVELRLLARGPGAGELVAEGERRMREWAGEYVFSSESESLEMVVIRLLTERGLTLATAESCTGGRLADRLTNAPGASRVFWGGLVTYADDAKIRLLGVRPETLAAHGAVSEATAREMAAGTRSRYGTAYAVAVTGIAGPGGGTPEKPVGTVYLAMAGPGGTLVLGKRNPFDRETFKFVTSQQALELLRRDMLGMSLE